MVWFIIFGKPVKRAALPGFCGRGAPVCLFHHEPFPTRGGEQQRPGHCKGKAVGLTVVGGKSEQTVEATSTPGYAESGGVVQGSILAGQGSSKFVISTSQVQHKHG